MLNRSFGSESMRYILLDMIGEFIGGFLVGLGINLMVLAENPSAYGIIPLVIGIVTLCVSWYKTGRDRGREIERGAKLDR